MTSKLSVFARVRFHSCDLEKDQCNSDDYVTERPEEPEGDDDEDEVVQGQKTVTSRGGKLPRTNRAEVNQLRSNPASSTPASPPAQAVITATDGSLTPSQLAATKSKKRKKDNQSDSKHSKKVKTAESPANPSGPALSGLKKAKKPKKLIPSTNEVEESMLQEGKSIGFDDNHSAELLEREQLAASSNGVKVPIKIEEKPIELPVGKAARNEGERRFTSRHLPDFILEGNGDRRVFTPLAKEAAGFVHSWGNLKKSLVQSMVKRGFDRDVTVAEAGKDAVSAVANHKVTNLRHQLATGATDIVQEFIKTHWTTSPPPEEDNEETEWVFRTEEDVAEWAKYMTTKYSIPSSKVQLSPMHFAVFEVDDDTGKILLRQGMFQHELLLRTLAIYYSHVDSIRQGIKWYDVDDEGKPRYPFGALEMSIQALEREESV